jgi:hypothetical protein
LAFDEAHILTTVQNSEQDYFSKFSELRRAIRALKELPIFSLFLSTAGKIQDLTPTADSDLSRRIQDFELQLLEPYTELGFDQMMKDSRLLDGTISIQDASTARFMSRFGRPL